MIAINFKPERGAREGSSTGGTAHRLPQVRRTQARHSIVSAAIASITRWLKPW
jgi:hypothetical protein